MIRPVGNKTHYTHSNNRLTDIDRQNQHLADKVRALSVAPDVLARPCSLAVLSPHASTIHTSSSHAMDNTRAAGGDRARDVR